VYFADIEGVNMINDPLALTMGIIFIASAIALASLLWAHKEALLPKYKQS
jgi:hypothetical protein